MLLSPYGQISQLKSTVNSSLGAVGVGVAATAEHISFVEGATFKTVVGVMGLVLVCITIFNVFLDVRRKLKEDE